MVEEIRELRTSQTKHYDLGGGSKRLVSYSGNVHYHDGSEFKTIKNDLVTSDRDGYDHMSEENSFTVHFKSNVNQSQSILIEYEDIEFSFTPKGMGLFNSETGDHVVVETPSDTSFVVEDNKITFPNLYPGVNSGFVVHGNGFKEFLEVENLPDIPVPTDYGYNPETTWVVFVNELDFNIDTLEDENGAVAEGRDLGVIQIKKGLNKIHIPELIGWDSGENAPQMSVKKRVKDIGGKPHLIHGLKYTEVMTSIYPLIIDASVDVDVAAALDDGWYRPATNFSASGSIQMGKFGISKSSEPGQCYVRFALSIPQGSTINTAAYNLYRNGQQGGTPVAGALNGMDVDNQGAWPSNPNGIAKTTASQTVNFANNPAVGAQVNIPDCSNVIQEVIDRAGWSSGNYLGLRLGANSTTGTGTNAAVCFAYDNGNATYYPNIVIDYTAAAPGAVVQINIGDDFKDYVAAWINKGDVWKVVPGMQINKGDVWKTIF